MRYGSLLQLKRHLELEGNAPEDAPTSEKALLQVVSYKFQVQEQSPLKAHLRISTLVFPGDNVTCRCAFRRSVVKNKHVVYRQTSKLRDMGHYSS